MLSVVFILVIFCIICIVRETNRKLQEKRVQVGTVLKNRHNGFYVVDIKGRKFNVESVDWNIDIGSKVTLQMYYGKFYITGLFIRGMEDVEIVSEIK